MQFNCEDLGISREEIVDRVIDGLVERLATEPIWDDEGGAGKKKSSLIHRMEKVITDRIDQKVQEIGDIHVVPRVDELIEGLCLQQTNTWGEKTGKALTLREYMVERAVAYIKEDVNYEGKAKGEDRCGGWSKYGTRLNFLIDKHLNGHISSAVNDMLKKSYEHITGGVEQAIKTALELAQKQITVKVERKR